MIRPAYDSIDTNLIGAALYLIEKMTMKKIFHVGIVVEILIRRRAVHLMRAFMLLDINIAALCECYQLDDDCSYLGQSAMMSLL